MKSLKINFSEAEVLNEKEMAAVQGGYCVCGCKYANNGGSSTDANGRANSNGNLRTEGTRPVAYNGEGDYYRE